MKKCFGSIASRGVSDCPPEGIVGTWLASHDESVRAGKKKPHKGREGEVMKKVIFGTLLTAGFVLAQAGAAAPAAPSNGSTNGQAPATQTQTKKHRKTHKSGSTANTNHNNSTPAGSGNGGTAPVKPATPATPAGK